MDGRVVRNTLLSTAVAAVFLYFSFRNVPIADVGAALGRLDYAWLLPAVFLSILLMLARTWRWQMELQPLELVPFGRLWSITAVAYMAINLIPARMGEVVRPWLLSRRSSVSISNVVGNLVVEKMMDSFAIVFFILVGLITTRDLPEWVRRGAMFPAIGALVLAVVVLLVYLRGEAFIDSGIGSLLPEGARNSVKRVTKAIVDGMRILPNGRLVLSVFVLSIAMWSLPILSSYALIRAFHFEVPFNAALIVFIFIGFGTALPNAPGMVGPFQAACIMALGIFGVPQADALAYGLVLNAIQVLTIVAQGAIALPLTGVSAGDFRRVTEDAAA